MTEKLLSKILGKMKMNKNMLLTVTLQQLNDNPEYKTLNEEDKAKRVQWVTDEFTKFPEEISFNEVTKWLNKLTEDKQP
jgi:hypothetical protein